MPKRKTVFNRGKKCCNTIEEELQADSCVSESRAVEQNKKRFEIKRKGNPTEEICKIDVDCWIPTPKRNQKKCDAIFVRCATQDFFFVELKGSGITKLDHVYEQLTSTIKHTQKHKELQYGRIHGYIIGMKLSTQISRRLQRLKDDFRKEYGGELVRSSGSYTKLLDS